MHFNEVKLLNNYLIITHSLLHGCHAWVSPRVKGVRKRNMLVDGHISYWRNLMLSSLSYWTASPSGGWPRNLIKLISSRLRHVVFQYIVGIAARYRSARLEALDCCICPHILYLSYTKVYPSAFNLGDVSLCIIDWKRAEPFLASTWCNAKHKQYLKYRMVLYVYFLSATTSSFIINHETMDLEGWISWHRPWGHILPTHLTSWHCLVCI